MLPWLSKNYRLIQCIGKRGGEEDILTDRDLVTLQLERELQLVLSVRHASPCQIVLFFYRVGDSWRLATT
jgi:hypothetical protein